MHFIKYSLCLVFIEFSSSVTGYQYNLTGSTEFAMLGHAFNWRCDMFIPPNQTNNGIKFFRNKVLCVIMSSTSNCNKNILNLNYTYSCVSKLAYTLTIPAKNMTEDEQNSTWSCFAVTDARYRSPDAILKIAIDVQNVSLIPPDNPLTIRKGAQKEVQCVVNNNAVPPPTFSWYLEALDITNNMRKSAINITGNENDNSKILKCRATNNNKTKAVNTTLNVEYPPKVSMLSEQKIVQGRDLSVTCHATPGNPRDTSFHWTKVDNSGFRQNGSKLQLFNIQRTSVGTYRCIAENFYSDAERGTHNQSMGIDVLYPPIVLALSRQDIIEGTDLSVTCEATPGNPRFSTFYWTNTRNDAFRQDGATLQLPKIERSSSSTYRCTVENNYNISEKGTDNQTMVVNVLYPPIVHNLTQQNIIEGINFSVTCNITVGNPRSTQITWISVDKPGFERNGTTLSFPRVHKTNSGNYTCKAENDYGKKGKGTHSQSMFLNVLYHPTIENIPRQFVNESENVIITRNIYSNPLSTVLWFAKDVLLDTQPYVTKATYSREKVTCTDTKNFTIVASNGIGNKTTAVVELIVNCKPMPDTYVINLGVTNTIGIEFSVTVIAYPEPEYELEHDNETKNTEMMASFTRNAVNNFTIHFNQTVVRQSDYGNYHLRVRNEYGEATVFVNVLPQKTPDAPRNVTVTCEVAGAKVQWISSFNGGDPQIFTVSAWKSQDEITYSNGVPDTGENKMHDTYIQNLQASTTYVFYVFAQNRHGNSLSENFTCVTSKKDTDSSLPLIAGGAATGGITLAVIVIVVVVLFRRFRSKDKQTGEAKRKLTQESEYKDVNEDDGMRDNVLYVSAGPKGDEEPEAAVYAAVNKKSPESNNNANVYADVKKSGQSFAEGALYSDVKPKRGLFKKDINCKKDGTTKKKKGKKQKSKQDVADVYENSEDIVMSSKSDNVYSNAGQKEERGYKNKDGLLYVEVQFDAKTEKGNQTIHGEDEKTDYATVEFPMAASTQDEPRNEKL